MYNNALSIFGANCTDSRVKGKRNFIHIPD